MSQHWRLMFPSIHLGAYQFQCQLSIKIKRFSHLCIPWFITETVCKPVWWVLILKGRHQGCDACSGTRDPPFFKSCMRPGFLLMRASFVMLFTTRSDARARKGVSFYLFACHFPVFLYTNCTSVYLVWQIHFFSDLEMYYVCGFVIKAMVICSSQMGVLDFGPALA